jgi:DNA-directed RNA polymerase II subunit RPB1
MASKINLSQEQIEFILDFIKPNLSIPSETALSIVNKVKNKLRKQLENVKIYETLIPKLKEQLESQYLKSQIQPGEAVGIVTAQSIGERQTQMTLNSFHSTGMSIKTVVKGVPRFTELLNATKDPKTTSNYVYFKTNNKSLEELKNSIQKNSENLINSISLSSLSIQQSKIEEETRLENWKKIYKNIYSIPSSLPRWYLRFVLNIETIHEFNLSLYKIAKKIEEEYSDLFCIFSPEHMGILDVYVIADFDNDTEVQTHLNDTVLPILQGLNLFGIEGIKTIFYEKKDNEWIIETEGSNFKKILGHPLVDFKKCLSDNMWDIYTTLGIEAVREYLIEEFINIVSSDGTFVNDSHIILLVDVMCNSGTIKSISRYGMSKDNSGPISRASFEESLKNFLDAAVYGENENISGVSASILLGKVPKIGTGICDLMMDMSFFNV